MNDDREAYAITLAHFDKALRALNDAFVRMLINRMLINMGVVHKVFMLLQGRLPRLCSPLHRLPVEMFRLVGSFLL